MLRVRGVGGAPVWWREEHCPQLCNLVHDKDDKTNAITISLVLTLNRDGEHGNMLPAKLIDLNYRASPGYSRLHTLTQRRT